MRRALGAATGIAALLLTTLVLPATTAQAVECGTANAALRAPVTASSVEPGTPFTADAAVDGDPGTRWSSDHQNTAQWLRVDLGSSKRVCGVTLAWEAAYSTAFRLEVSTDGTSWTTAYSTTDGRGGQQELALDATGRYVRLTSTARATQYGVSLWEFAIRTASGTDSPKLLSYGKPAFASTYQDNAGCGGCTPAKVTDLNPATRWATAEGTGWVDPGWISVDLGATAQLSSVVLQWDPAYATAFQVQTSATAQQWTTVYETTTGTGFKQTIPVSGSGRYVRVNLLKRSGPYGYSLWEFQVYGTGGNPTAPPAPAPDPGNPLRLVWSDEFNTTAGTKPDSAKWRPEVGTGQNAELQFYTNNNNAFTDGGGNLVLEARREVTPGSACPVDPVSGSGTCQYTSARLITEGKASWTYGRVEARIKVSGGKGLWPAFWMLGDDIFRGTPWPGSGEIDIMEHLGREPNTAYQTIHGPAYFGGGGIGKPLDIGRDVAGEFHVFRADWTSRGITFSIDGTQVLAIDKATVEATRGPWVFDKPFFILLNNAVGGDWPGPPDAGTAFPQRMLVDYVRVYQ
ncbi:discoidin domain-containing protein [Actinokineospora bangkokensis]|uniref:discoidin domain-containing protein n=1 Tax=Actinokineospora bangkokensis TaxID=1193682 RepID=UPI00096B2E06|nr:discoidin domain-containing protein [Actinokineospora bangkokensis]